MAEKGWIQQEKPASAVPVIKSWWEAEGKNLLLTEKEWKAGKNKKTSSTKRDKRFNFVKGNPD